MSTALRYVSSPAKMNLQSYYDGADFATYTTFLDAVSPLPVGTPWLQSLILEVSPWNVVDLDDGAAWLPGFITAFADDALLSQIAINGTIFPPAGATPGTVLDPEVAPTL